MDKKQYNNIIDWTLQNQPETQTEDSLTAVRAVCNNMGIALPQGDLAQVAETLATDDYMYWHSCTPQEAQEAADNGIPTIGISEDSIVLLAATDEEQPVTTTAATITLAETSACTAQGTQYYVYGCGVTNSYITVGGWLKMYTKPTCTNSCGTVSIPNVKSYTGPDGYKYEFTDRTNWFSYENPYGDDYINPYFLKEFKKMNKLVTVNIGDSGEYTDENGRYWMAVGPKVIVPDFADDCSTWAQHFAGKGTLDVVVKDSNGNKYYIPGTVGDIKNHTWNNGVIQTFKAYPNGDYDSANGNFNATCAAEFIGSLGGKMGDLDSYSIDSIRFYPSNE